MHEKFILLTTLWNSEKEQWYFSIVDVVAVLTNQNNYQGARNYWKVLKFRLLKEGNETVTNCNRLKLLAEDGKMRLNHSNNGWHKLHPNDWMKCKILH